MKTILALAAAAIAAVVSYAKHRQSPTTGIDGIRQATSVLLAVGQGLWAVLDALMFLRAGPMPTSPLRQQGSTFGSRLAADV